MAKISKIEKFLCALLDNGGEMGRAQLAITVFARNWSAAQLDDLLAAPELRGLVTVSRSLLRGRHAKGSRRKPRGRPAIRYCLTGSGWALLKSGLRCGVRPFRICTEEVQRQFGLLVADSDPWAVELSRQAARGREWEALEAVKREDERQARQAARDAQKSLRQRSQKDIEARERFFEGKMAEQGKARNAEGRWRPIEEVEEERAAHTAAVTPLFESAAPTVPRAPCEPITTPRSAPVATVVSAGDDNSDWRRYVSMPSRPAGFEPTQMLMAPDKNTAALLVKIQRAGYQTRDGKVLFGGNQWIDPHEWARRMSGILD